MPVTGNITLASLRVRLDIFNLFPVYRLTSGLTVFGGFFKPEQFPTTRILAQDLWISNCTATDIPSSWLSNCQQPIFVP
jgi:hypothetical protein